MNAERSLTVWLPDWPVVAAAAELALDASAPIALMQGGVVFACSAAARSAGVTRGLKQREAQYRCPGLTVARYDERSDARRFEPLVRALEEATPGLHVVRPGLVATRARGPARYYGSEEAAALAFREVLIERGASDVRSGCADGLFAAEHAARFTSALEPVRIVPPGASAAFVAPLTVDTVAPDERTATVLRRLGIHTLGQFAELAEADVARRFGPAGAWAHAQAAGRDPRRVLARQLPAEFSVEVPFEPPLERSDQIAFAMREHAETFDRTLREARLVCTALRIDLTDEHGRDYSRNWLHPRWFSPVDVVDRIRWQLDGLLRDAAPMGDDRMRTVEAFERLAIASVRLQPERLDQTANHEAGLWGGGPDARIHHALSRVQSLLGPEAVATALLRGGRSPAERQLLVPWGDAPPSDTGREQPWPGALPGIAPATVFTKRVPIGLSDARGEVVAIDERGAWSAPPATLRLSEQQEREVRAWAGPWPLVERWWDSERASHGYRAQLVDSVGDAWLVHSDADGWRLEARYD